MTSKDALDILLYFAKSDNSGFEPYLKLRASQIEKDLEILEILKYRIHLKEDIIKNDAKDYDIAWVEASGFVFRNSKEYTLLKEWLENDK